MSPRLSIGSHRLPTALSKAHRLLQRFSEDVDYRVVSLSLAVENPSRQRRLLSDFKATVIECLDG